MAKLDPRRLPKKYRDELEWTLHVALRRLGLTERNWRILRALFTDSEVVMFARRIKVAECLLMGVSFEEIERELHVGLATIRFVYRILGEDIDQLQFLLRSLQSARAKKKSHSLKRGTFWEIDPHSFDGLRARFPRLFPIANFLLGDPREKYELDEEAFSSRD